MAGSLSRISQQAEGGTALQTGGFSGACYEHKVQGFTSESSSALSEHNCKEDSARNGKVAAASYR